MFGYGAFAVLADCTARFVAFLMPGTTLSTVRYPRYMPTVYVLYTHYGNSDLLKGIYVLTNNDLVRVI